ncbi:MAG: hypothetical protein ACOC4J_05875 [Bacteroidota bacterium]
MGEISYEKFDDSIDTKLNSENSNVFGRKAFQKPLEEGITIIKKRKYTEGSVVLEETGENMRHVKLKKCEDIAWIVFQIVENEC